MEELFYKIVKADENDWDEAMELAWRTFLKFEAPQYEQEGIDNFLNFISGELLHTMFLNGDYVMYVAKDNADRIIGVASMRAVRHISLLFVDEKFHRKGIARALLSRLQSDLKGEIKLTVNAAPYATEFYHKVGFWDTNVMQKTDGITYTPMTCLVRI